MRGPAFADVQVARAYLVMWRTEARFFSADDAVFPDRDTDFEFSETSTALVTALSIRI